MFGSLQHNRIQKLYVLVQAYAKTGIYPITCPLNFSINSQKLNVGFGCSYIKRTVGQIDQLMGSTNTIHSWRDRPIYLHKPTTQHRSAILCFRPEEFFPQLSHICTYNISLSYLNLVFSVQRWDHTLFACFKIVNI